MIRIGLTGSIASGKSTVSGILQQLGATIIDADGIARQIVEPGQPAWQHIVGRLGQSILLPDQTIDRAQLSDLVFKDKSLRHWLNGVTHPYVQQVMLQLAATVQAQGCLAVVLDVPLLIEANWLHMVDAVWLVYVDKETQVERLMRRNGYTRQAAMARIDAQLSLDDKVGYADVIIDNSHSLEVTRQQVERIWKQVLLSP